MKSLRTIKYISALAAASVVFAAQASATASEASPIPAPRAAQHPLPPGAHKLLTTVVQFGTAAGTGIVAGFNTINTATETCPNAAGCTITSTVMVQIAPAAGALWAICTTVDGNYMSPGCPYQGTLPGAGTYLTGNMLSNATVAQGSHTVTTQVYVSADSVLGNWQAEYNTLKP